MFLFRIRKTNDSNEVWGGLLIIYCRVERPPLNRGDGLRHNLCPLTMHFFHHSVSGGHKGTHESYNNNNNNPHVTVRVLTTRWLHRVCKSAARAGQNRWSLLDGRWNLLKNLMPGATAEHFWGKPWPGWLRMVTDTCSCATFLSQQYSYDLSIIGLDRKHGDEKTFLFVMWIHCLHLCLYVYYTASFLKHNPCFTPHILNTSTPKKRSITRALMSFVCECNYSVLY